MKTLKALSFALLGCGVVIGFLFFRPGLALAKGSSLLTPDFDRSEYQIFPEGRLGNSLYQKKVWLFSDENCLIKDFFVLPSKVLVIWCQDKKGGSFYSIPAKGIDSLQRFTGGRFLLDRAKNMLIYASENGSIQILKLNFKSAAGFLLNDNGLLAMFHTVKSTQADPASPVTYQYQVHIYNEHTTTFHTLPNVFIGQKANLEMHWENNTLVVRPTAAEVYQFPIQQGP